MSRDHLPSKSSDDQVNAFLRRVANTPAPVTASGQGRLIFALDATASRQPTWDRACQLQGEMFTETAALGGLNIQLVWYRGFGEFDAGPWLRRGDELARRMTSVHCAGGTTQIEQVLNHALHETRQHRINALVFVGDCMEENADLLCGKAGELGMLGVPLFIFQEGRNTVAEQTFRQMATVSRGAWCPFDAGSARQLRELLQAVAVYAAGGRRALEDFGQRRGGEALRLTRQMSGDRS